MGDEQLILKLEQDLLMPEVRTSKQRLENIIANNFIEIGQSGTLYNKQDIVSALCNEQPTQITATKMSVQLLEKNLALASYQTSSHNRPMVQRYSLWENKGPDWQILYHEAERPNG